MLTDGRSTAELIVKYGEKKCRTYNLGGGIVNFGLEDLTNSRGGGKRSDCLFGNLKGNFGFADRCLFGRNETLKGEAQLGVNDISASIEHTDNWVPRDRHRTKRVSTLRTTRNGVGMIHGPMDDGDGKGADAASPIYVERYSGAIEYVRSLSQCWTGSLGVRGVRAACTDADTNQRVWKDRYGCPLTAHDNEADRTALGFLKLKHYSPRTTLALEVSQAVPLKKEWNLLKFTRAEGRIEHILPIAHLISRNLPFARLELNAKGGGVVGDLPAYEAFPLGGAGTVRGWQDGAIGTARNYAAGMVEVVVPAFGGLDMVAFCDYANDFDSGSLVAGDPAGVTLLNTQHSTYLGVSSGGGELQSRRPKGNVHLHAALQAHPLPS